MTINSLTRRNPASGSVTTRIIMPSNYAIQTSSIDNATIDGSGNLTLSMTGQTPVTIPAAMLDPTKPLLAANPNTSGSGFWEWLESLRKKVWT